jgi:hypothetical protein
MWKRQEQLEGKREREKDEKINTEQNGTTAVIHFDLKNVTSLARDNALNFIYKINCKLFCGRGKNLSCTCKWGALRVTQLQARWRHVEQSETVSSLGCAQSDTATGPMKTCRTVGDSVLTSWSDCLFTKYSLDVTRVYSKISYICIQAEDSVYSVTERHPNINFSLIQRKKERKKQTNKQTNSVVFYTARELYRLIECRWSYNFSGNISG